MLANRFNHRAHLLTIPFALALLLAASGCGGSSRVAGNFQPNYAAHILATGGSLDRYGTKVITFGITTPNPTKEQVSLVQSGAHGWDIALGKEGYSLSYTTTAPQIQVQLVSTSDLTAFLIQHSIWNPAANTIGVSYVDIDNATGYIVDSVSMLDEDLWDEFSDGKNLSMHEVGHSLGLGGHSDESSDVMYPTAPDRLHSEPTERDNNTMAYVYSGTANTAATPTPVKSEAPSLTCVIVGVDEAPVAVSAP